MISLGIETERSVPPEVPGGSRIYAVGDIHGRADLLGPLLDMIAADAADAPGRIVVIFLGDLIDRGPASSTVVGSIAAGPPAGPLARAEWIALRGNHEDSLLRFLDDTAVGPGWFMNGGLDTIRSYAGELPDDDPATLQRLLAQTLPPAHLRFLSALPTTHEEGDYLFVHAGVQPELPLAEQSPRDLLWIREPFLHWPGRLEKVVVHGHTIVPVPEIRPHRIGVDTGAYRSGRLTALVLEGADRRFLAARLRPRA